MYRFQTRLTITCANRSFSGETTSAASAWRLGTELAPGNGPVSACAIKYANGHSGAIDSPGFNAILTAGTRPPGATGTVLVAGSLSAFPLSIAARLNRSFCLNGWNGASWQRAQPSF